MADAVTTVLGAHERALPDAGLAGAGESTSPPSDEIVAYRERPSDDPETGEPGVLRDEWRVREVGYFQPEELIAAFGDDWRRARPFASHVLEHRYIRRGAEEPWTPFDAASSFQEAIEDIDTHAAALHPALKKLQQGRQEYAEQQRHKEEEKREKEAAAEERAFHSRRSKDAFVRLLGTRDRVLGEQWNAFNVKHGADQEYKDRMSKDPAFMAAYTAVLDAETVPAKRKAIKKFLNEYGATG